MADRFWQRLEEGVLICDGAMGTMLYQKGVPKGHCYDELNLSRPEVVKNVHLEYLRAGADIVETNTFGANGVILQRYYDLGDKAREINYQGARIAREVAEDGLVAGSVGPITRPFESLLKPSPEEMQEAFTEQIEALLEGGVDLLILETFSDLAEMEQSFLTARRLTDLPVICQMTFLPEGKTLSGVDPLHFAKRLTELGARILGANCCRGPQDTLDAVQEIGRVSPARLSAQPNAGLPSFSDGKFFYPSTPEYFAEYAKKYVEIGVSIVGGCCGSNPDHIKAICRAVKGAEVKARQIVQVEVREEEAPTPKARPPSLRDKFKKKFIVTVEIDPPRGTVIDKELRGVESLKEAGVDAVNISDSPMARVRLSPLPLAQIVKNRIGLDVILHFTCRDRNIIALQSDLLGAHALGIDTILALTGDPPSVGDYPYATAVFEITSEGLVQMMKTLNEGFDLAGNPIGEPTSFLIGVAVNPSAKDPSKEVERLQAKVEAGAHFAQTQPVFDVRILEEFLKLISHLEIPLIVSVLPLYNYRHTEFLHNEVPGIEIPDLIRERMKKVGDKGAEEGAEIARELLSQLKGLVQGVSLMPPFKRYDLALKIIS